VAPGATEIQQEYDEMTIQKGGGSTETIPILLLTPRQAAKALNISERTLFSRTKAGEIPAVHIGRCKRYSPDDLRQWVQRVKGA
jgi:excisionase family DNA binding protein